MIIDDNYNKNDNDKNDNKNNIDDNYIDNDNTNSPRIPIRQGWL